MKRFVSALSPVVAVGLIVAACWTPTAPSPAPTPRTPAPSPAPQPSPTPTPSPSPSPTPGPQPPPPSPPSLRNVFVIVFENHNWSDIEGNGAAPYINSLLAQSAHALQYFTPPGLHPSAPNYLWLEAGQDFGLRGRSIYAPALDHQSSTDHLVTELANAGISWKTYQEDIDGTSCPLQDVNRYVTRHNPFVFFDDVTNRLDAASAYCIAHVRPMTELARDLGRNTVARYNFIVPNVCNDMHDCGIGTGDAWLGANLPLILGSQAYSDGGVVFVLWDEGANATSDGPIGLIVMSVAAKSGYANTIPYTHSSLLLTIQEIFGVRPLLGDAANATDLTDLFVQFPAVLPSTPALTHRSTRLGTQITLTWSSSGASDDVYFGITNPPPLVVAKVGGRSYTPPLLGSNTTYYWRVVSTTAAGTAEGPVWEFRTEEGAGARGRAPLPRASR